MKMPANVINVHQTPTRKPPTRRAKGCCQLHVAEDCSTSQWHCVSLWSSRKPGKAGGFVAGWCLGSGALTPLQSRARNLVLGQLWFHFSLLVRVSWGCFSNSGVAVFWTLNLFFFKVRFLNNKFYSY